MILYDNIDEIDPMSVITIIMPVKILGDDGSTYYWFRPRRQYLFTDSEVRSIDCNGCGQYLKNQLVLHYKVTINEINYWIPKPVTAIENYIRPDYEQSYEAWRESKYHRPVDYKKELKLLTGIDLEEIEGNMQNRRNFARGYIDDKEKEA